MATPLADRIRPQTIDEMVGQEHLIGENKPLRNIIDSGTIPNMIFYGPSGTGKTTLARMIAKKTDKNLRKLNCTTASTQDIRDIFDELNTFNSPNGILLYLDEIQYFNKKQQQTLLEFIENGSITLIASTTENPYFYVYSAILSRSSVFEFKAVTPKEAEKAVNRAFSVLAEEYEEEFDIEEGVSLHIATASGGDVRKSLNAVELCVLSSNPPKENEKRIITLENAKALTQKSAMRYDREGDEHYDILSAFQKSMRGSDPNAAVYYLARMIEAGEDPLFIARRMLIFASEDIGNANPNALLLANTCFDAVNKIGYPECRIVLSQTAVYLATSIKSNSTYKAIGVALDAVRRTGDLSVPLHIRNAPTKLMKDIGYGADYKYAHDYQGNFVDQEFLPAEIAGTKFYEPGDNPRERETRKFLVDRWKKYGY